MLGVFLDYDLITDKTNPYKQTKLYGYIERITTWTHVPLIKQTKEAKVNI